MLTRISNALFLMTFALMSSGCAATGTETGAPPASQRSLAASYEAKTVPERPEVTIMGATRKRVADALTSHLVSNGWNVAQTNEYQAVYEQDAKGGAAFASGMFYGSATQPVYRLTVQFVEISGSVKVTATQELVSNPGTNRTTRTPLKSGKARQQVQALLDSIREQTAHTAAPAVSDTSTAR